ncbi:unnamed protein product [Closterium sp. NIES-65]|nr:unnamed protein product [Closterium sp. NIES-65]
MWGGTSTQTPACPSLPISQPSDQRPRIAECFDKLMADVGRNLHPKSHFSTTLNSPLFCPFNSLNGFPSPPPQNRSASPSDQRPRIAECFDKLMADVGRNLDPKNRDKFTQNLTIFRHDFRAK